MMGRMMAFIVVVVCTAQVVLLRAQEPLDLADKRFTYHQIDDGYLRLDLRTGEVATCRQREAGWTCMLAAEERAALETEIARLQRDNALLKSALLERGLPLPAPGTGAPGAAAPLELAPPPAAQAPTSPPAASAPSPSDPPTSSAPPRSPAPIPAEPDLAQRDKAEVDRVMDMMERLWRRLVELVTTIQRDIQRKG
jgi:hypothetical protein